jgi:hypothetical protein
MSNENMVVIEVMPSAHRGSHRAAGNWGQYPLNGARRYITTLAWAQELTANAEYSFILRNATAEDLADYEPLPEQW